MKVVNKKLFIILLAFILFFTPVVLAEDEFPEGDGSIHISYINDDPSQAEEGESTEQTEEAPTDVQTVPNVYKNEKTGFVAEIDDLAHLLSDEEVDKLLQDMIPLTEYGNVVFLSVDSNYTSTKNFAEETYHSTFHTQSGSLFLIDMDNREIYIFSDGYNYKVINEQKALSITDNTYTYASRKDYYGCASKAFTQMYTVLDGGKINEPMRLASNVFISLALAFFISFMFVLSQTKIRKASADEILKNCDIEFKTGKVTATKNGTKKVFSPISSSSGSSGGFSSGGGGHSSFGGGGHSGGFSGGGHSGGGGGHRF